jgi:homoserine kinase
MKKIKSPFECVTAYAPYSSANLACGFDILGAALDLGGDTVTIRQATSDKISLSGAPLTVKMEENCAYIAARALADKLVGKNFHFLLELKKMLPVIGSGLGSSAASAVAATFATNALFGSPLTKEDLLIYADIGEAGASGSYHSDNTGASLFGGITLATPHNKIIKLNTPKELGYVVILPDAKIATKEARAILKPKVALSLHVKQSALLAEFCLALERQDYHQLSLAFQDLIIEPQRASFIPHFYQIKELTLKAAALGTAISGSGPAIISLTDGRASNKKIMKELKKFAEHAKINVTFYCGSFDMQGARLHHDCSLTDNSKLEPK